MKKYVTLCQRCAGIGRYDRGACFGCKAYGATGWTVKARRTTPAVQVTAIRDIKEGRIEWIKIYGASAKQAVAIVQRQMSATNKPKELQESLQAKYIQGEINEAIY